MSYSSKLHKLRKAIIKNDIAEYELELSTISENDVSFEEFNNKPLDYAYLFLEHKLVQPIIDTYNKMANNKYLNIEECDNFWKTFCPSINSGNDIANNFYNSLALILASNNVTWSGSVDILKARTNFINNLNYMGNEVPSIKSAWQTFFSNPITPTNFSTLMATKIAKYRKEGSFSNAVKNELLEETKYSFLNNNLHQVSDMEALENKVMDFYKLAGAIKLNIELGLKQETKKIKI